MRTRLCPQVFGNTYTQQREIPKLSVRSKSQESILSQRRDKYRGAEGRERRASFKYTASIKPSAGQYAHVHIAQVILDQIETRQERERERQRETLVKYLRRTFIHSFRHRLTFPLLSLSLSLSLSLCVCVSISVCLSFSLSSFTLSRMPCVSPRMLDGFLRARIYICRCCFRLDSTTDGLNAPCPRRCRHCNPGDLLLFRLPVYVCT